MNSEDGVYIGTSLDGFIARKEGDIDRLKPIVMIFTGATTKGRTMIRIEDSPR